MELRLVDLCPNWMEALRTGRTDKQLAIENNKRCMVGEAWGFSDKYATKCGECYRCCLEFAYCVYGSVSNPNHDRYYGVKQKNYFIKDLPLYKMLVRQFVAHFNQCHLDVWIWK